MTLIDQYKRAVATCGEVDGLVEATDNRLAWDDGVFAFLGDKANAALLCDHVEGWLIERTDNGPCSYKIKRDFWRHKNIYTWYVEVRCGMRLEHDGDYPTKLDALLKCAEAVKEME